MTDSPDRRRLAGARRIVIKLGTRVLTHDDGRLALARLFAVVEAAAAVRRAGREVLVVSSGAVGLGREALGVPASSDLAERQACAAVGQSRLMGLYDQGFSRCGLVTAQILLTESDLDDRERYLNLRRTLQALLRHGVVPILNENDAVSTDELALFEGSSRPVFGDNDRLSALVASKLDADLLVLLTDVDGVYERDPRIDPEARLLSVVPDDLAVAGGTGSAASRGGMSSKVAAARIAARAGCDAVVASGRGTGALERVLAGEDEGSWFPGAGELSARRRWIGFVAAPRGRLGLDAGAVAALRDRGASLLAVGVHSVQGSFGAGDVVELVDGVGVVVGRGVISVDADTARRWAAGQAPQNVRNHDALVHRDHLVLDGTTPRRPESP